MKPKKKFIYFRGVKRPLGEEERGLNIRGIIESKQTFIVCGTGSREDALGLGVSKLKIKSLFYLHFKTNGQCRNKISKIFLPPLFSHLKMFHNSNE